MHAGPRTSYKLKRIAGLLALALSVVWTAAGTAAIVRPRPGRFFALAVRGSSRLSSASVSGRSSRAPAAAPLADGALPSSYLAAVERYFADLARASESASAATDNVYSVTAQYHSAPLDDGSPTAMVPQSFNVQTDAIHDNAAFPPDQARGNARGGCQAPTSLREPSDPPYSWCLTDAQIQAELESVIAAEHLPRGLGAAYYMLLGPGVDVCTEAAQSPTRDCADENFCSYHSSSITAGGNASALVYAVIPWPDVSGCTSGEAPNGSGGDDPGDDAANIISHESTEAVTDPLGTGWHANGNLEVADLCARTSGRGTTYGPALGGGPGEAFNQIINGHHYWLQEQYSLVDTASPSAAGTCEQRPGTDNASEPPNAPEPDLTYHGGPVLGAHRNYVVFWESSGNGQIPSAAFTESTSAAPLAEPVSFTAAETSDAQGGLSYAWDFGDGTSTSTSLPSVTHAYSSPGSKVVKLTVSDRDGYAASSTQSITVYRPPIAAFTAPVTLLAGQPASFSGRGSGDPEGTIQSWSWDFGDGVAAAGPIVTHAFSHPGYYRVRLTVTDSNDSSASEVHTVQVLAARAMIARASSVRALRAGRDVLILTGRSVTCPAAALGCRVIATLTTLTPAAHHGHRRSTPRTITIGRASLSIAPGRRAAITVRLGIAGVALLRHVRRLSCTLAMTARASDGADSAASFSFRLSAPRSLPP